MPLVCAFRLAAAAAAGTGQRGVDCRRPETITARRTDVPCECVTKGKRNKIKKGIYLHANCDVSVLFINRELSGPFSSRVVCLCACFAPPRAVSVLLFSEKMKRNFACSDAS